MDIKLESPPEAHYTVYKLTSPDGKVYIGCTGSRLKRRWDSGRNYWSSVPIGEAIAHFGWENFRKEILCEKLTKEGAEELEKWFIEYYDSRNPEKGYNRITGGNRKGSKFSEESRKKISEATLRVCLTNKEFNRNHSNRMKAYYREHPEKRAEISANMSSYLLSPEGRKFVESDSSPKPVRCVETGVVYPSQRAAEKMTGFQNIHRVCSGRSTLSGGYHWEYYTPAE